MIHLSIWCLSYSSPYLTIHRLLVILVRPVCYWSALNPSILLYSMDINRWDIEVICSLLWASVIIYSYTLSLSFTLSTKGHGGSFIVGNPELYTISSPSSISSYICRHYTGIVACQAPLYVHEIHLISNTVDEAFLADTSLYEMMVTCYIECLIERLYEHKRLSVKHPVWSVDFVDLYICPRRNKLIYTIQGTTVVYISCI